MLTPRSSRTSPCCRPEASTRNDSRRLSAICEKSTFLQYLMEEIAQSGPLEDQRICLAEVRDCSAGWQQGHRARCLGRNRTAAASSLGPLIDKAKWLRISSSDTLSVT